MSKENGYLQHRRGIWEHVRDGRLSLQDVAVHQYIASQADTRTGIWNGSAGALAGELCISPRVARRFLERLSRGDYIKRFPTPGKHVCYPILVHKFAITDGEHRGEHLNALASSSPVDLRYFPGEQMGEHRGEQLSSQKRIENREERKNTPAAPVPQPNTVEQETIEAGFQAFWEWWPLKQAKSDARRAWGKIPLAEYAAVSAGLERWKTSDQWKRGIIPHAATWLNGKRWTDEVPQFVGGNNGNGNTKQTATGLALQNARALGLGQPN